jgi:hypothetical protein
METWWRSRLVGIGEGQNPSPCSLCELSLSPLGRREDLPYDLNHMLNLADHTAHFRRILKLTNPVHLVEAKADQRCALILGTADGRTRLLDLDCRHDLTPPLPQRRLLPQLLLHHRA